MDGRFINNDRIPSTSEFVRYESAAPLSRQEIERFYDLKDVVENELAAYNEVFFMADKNEKSSEAEKIILLCYSDRLIIKELKFKPNSSEYTLANLEHMKDLFQLEKSNLENCFRKIDELAIKYDVSPCLSVSIEAVPRYLIGCKIDGRFRVAETYFQALDGGYHSQNSTFKYFIDSFANEYCRVSENACFLSVLGDNVQNAKFVYDEASQSLVPITKKPIAQYGK